MNKIIMYIIGLFFLLGGVDYILGNKFKLGEKFEEGIKAMGALGLGMIGIYSLAPILSKVLAKVVIPISKVMGIDPSIIPASILAVDMGGWQLARNLALSKEMALFSGIILASNLGATISFSIPLAIGMIPKKDHEYFSKGVMVGITTIPIGAFFAGLYLGINFKELLYNLFPIILFSLILGIGLIKIPEILIRVFNAFGTFIVALSIIGLLLQSFSVIFGVSIIKDLTPFSESMTVVGKIAFVLGGAYSMLTVLNRIFKSSFEKLGKKLGVNSAAVGGLLGNLASNLLIFGTFKDMDDKGKVICTAFAVSGAFVFGGQLGFVSGVAPEAVGAFIISKFIGGIISVYAASWIFDLERKN